MTDGELDRDLVLALQYGDPVRVARIYAKAADLMVTDGDLDSACFLLTQAWIFALEAGDPMAKELRAKLVKHGREIEQ